MNNARNLNCYYNFKFLEIFGLMILNDSKFHNCTIVLDYNEIYIEKDLCHSINQLSSGFWVPAVCIYSVLVF